MIRVVILIMAVGAIFWVCLFTCPVPVNPFLMSGTEKEILLYIRLPRVVTAGLMGAGLGVGGTLLQGMLRNPLADPYILGLSSGATLMAGVVIMSGITFFGAFTIPVFAFIGSMATGLLVGLLSWRRGGIWPERLLLAGIGVGFLFSATLMLLMSVTTNEALRRATLWLFGDLGMADWSLIPYSLVFIATGLFIAVFRAKALNTLMLGDDLSHSLGFSPRKETTLLFISVGLITASSVSLGGIVGFIGLLIPHIMRFLISPDNQKLIPASALGGSALLVISDTLGKSLFQPIEIPAGIITAILGAPYFLYLLRRQDVIG